MTKKFIDLRQVVAALRIAADGIETDDVDGLTLNAVYTRIDDALRVTMGRKNFDEVERYSQVYCLDCDDETDDDEVDNPETPKF